MSIPVVRSNAVRCLAVKPGEHFQALVDEPFADVGTAALRRRARGRRGIGGLRRRARLRASAATAYEPFVASLAETDARLLLVHARSTTASSRASASRSTRARSRRGTRVAFGGRMDRSILEHEMAADYDALRELSAAPGGAARTARRACASRRPAAPTARST